MLLRCSSFVSIIGLDFFFWSARIYIDIILFIRYGLAAAAAAAGKKARRLYSGAATATFLVIYGPRELVRRIVIYNGGFLFGSKLMLL